MNRALQFPGMPLGGELRRFMEGAFAHDLSAVRVHADPAAAESARAIDAAAYAIGPHVVFASGEYSPHTLQGLHLIAHEIAHTIQQPHQMPTGTTEFSIGLTSCGAEHEAEIAANDVVRRVEPRRVSMRMDRPLLQRASKRPASANVHQPATTRKPKERNLSLKEYIQLVREAERILSQGGMTSVADRLIALRGIYYGTEKSADFVSGGGRSQKENEVRAIGFNIFAGHRPPDAETLLNRRDLFEGLRAAREVSFDGRSVDIGHLLIGLEARLRAETRREMPIVGFSGLEAATWVGDLGGGVRALARSRMGTWSKSVTLESLFGDEGFAKAAHLDADIASYGVSADITAPKGQPSAARLGQLSIADWLENYFVTRRQSAEGWNSRVEVFLVSIGAELDSTGRMANRTTVRDAIAAKLSAFAKTMEVSMGIASQLSRQPKKPNVGPIRPSAGEITQEIELAADEVASRFLIWLERQRHRARADSPKRQEK